MRDWRVTEDVDMTRYWKVTDADGRSCHGGEHQWSVPTWDGVAWTPGEWTARIDDVKACNSGWHVCTDEQLVGWLGARIWHVEIHPHATTIVLDLKVITTGPVRLTAGTPWDDTTTRLFAVECAARVLHLANDVRCDDACEVAFRYALGDATDAELYDARTAAMYAVFAGMNYAKNYAMNYAKSAAMFAAADAAVTAARGAADAAANAVYAVYAADAAAYAAEAAHTTDLLRWLEVTR